MDSDRLKKALLGFFQSARAQDDGIDFLACYPAKIVSQNASDFTLELIPEDPRLPSISKVPLRPAIPGLQIKVAPGGRALLFFEGGSPKAPAAALFQSSTLVELVITATIKVTVNAPDIRLGDGVGSVVRVGDTITGLTSPSGPVTGSIVTAVQGLPTPGPSKVKA